MAIGLVVLAATCAADTIQIDRKSVAAIAYSPATGKYGCAYNLRSRSTAEKAALADCGADDARVVCWVKDGFCILALGDDKACWGVGWQYGSSATTEAPRKKAIADCGNRTTNPRLVLVLSSDGQLIEDARKATTVTTITDSSGKTYTVTGSPGAEAAPVASPSPPPRATEESGSMLDAVLKVKDASGGEKK